MIHLTPEEEKQLATEITDICWTISQYRDKPVMQAIMATVIDTVCVFEGIDKRDFLLTMLETTDAEIELNEDFEY